MREQTEGTWLPPHRTMRAAARRIKAPLDLKPVRWTSDALRCPDCGHLRLQHGKTEYTRSRPGCWLCKCQEEPAPVDQQPPPADT